MSTSCGFNLIRNARMFFTTNVDSCSGAVLTDGFTAANTKEIQVLDGLSFSQATSSETVTLNEAGDSPSRGQRSFNTALEPVELTFSTYMRPYYTEGNSVISGFDTDDYVAAEEDVLWNAFAAGKDNGANELIGNPIAFNASKPADGTAGHSSAWTAYYGDDTPLVEPKSVVGFDFSGKNQMVNFGVIITLDSTAYIIDNCVLDQASIDFGLDAISTIAWTARGSRLRSVNLFASQASGGVVTFTGNYLTGPSPSVPQSYSNVVVNATTDILSLASVDGNHTGLRVGMPVAVTNSVSTTPLSGIDRVTPLQTISIATDTFTVDTPTPTLANNNRIILKVALTNSTPANNIEVDTIVYVRDVATVGGTQTFKIAKTSGGTAVTGITNTTFTNGDLELLTAVTNITVTTTSDTFQIAATPTPALANNDKFRLTVSPNGGLTAPGDLFVRSVATSGGAQTFKLSTVTGSDVNIITARLIENKTYYVVSKPAENSLKLSESPGGSSINLTATGTCTITYNKDVTADVAKAKVTTAPFLANKLSVVTLQKGITGGGKSYSLALTGGNITLSNNVTYLTPANLGTVNQPFTYFTGTRAISGSLNCYLKTGSANSAGLLEDMLATSTTDVEPAYKLKISMGNPDTAGKVRVVLDLPAAVLTIPAINTEQVVSSTVNFTAQGYDDASDVFSICANNEATITYYSAVC